MLSVLVPVCPIPSSSQSLPCFSFFFFFFITLHHANMVVYFPLGPRLETGGMPDLNYCRLYQKLQVSHTR